MSEIPERIVRYMYRTMVRIRICEESFVEPILDRTIRCPVHLCSGEEAIATGVCAALSEDDYVFGTHRSHGHYLAKGGCLRELVAEVYCKETGCSKGRGGSMHLIAPEKGVLGVAPIVGGTIALAAGAALASKIRGDGRVTVSFFGDGATGEGALSESLNFAALHRLPIIFACENNYYSTHMPMLECRPKDNIHETGLQYGMESHRVDGNDVLKVYERAKEAVERCKSGDGPVFIEFMTYRQRGHVGPDDNIQGTHTDIRPPDEIAEWNKKDPIIRFEQFLVSRGLFNGEDLEGIRREAQREVDEAHDAAKKSPSPRKEDLTAHVFKQ